jgi:hypothetical protein
MRIKRYSDFLESLEIDLSYQMLDIMESLNMWHDVLLASIGAQQVDIFSELKISDSLRKNLDIDYLNDNVEFLNSLSSLRLKKSAIQNTDDYETFINKPCKFMMIYDQTSNELQNPEYIIFQSWNDTIKKWEDAKLYKITEDIKKFFDKLTSRTIEIVDGDTNYIYNTSNGNDWELQNLNSETDIYKRFFRKEELQKLLDDRKVKLNII